MRAKRGQPRGLLGIIGMTSLLTPTPVMSLVADLSAKHGLLIFCAWDSYNNSDF